MALLLLSELNTQIVPRPVSQPAVNVVVPKSGRLIWSQGCASRARSGGLSHSFWHGKVVCMYLYTSNCKGTSAVIVVIGILNAIHRGKREEFHKKRKRRAHITGLHCTLTAASIAGLTDRRRQRRPWKEIWRRSKSHSRANTRGIPGRRERRNSMISEIIAALATPNDDGH